MIKQKNLINLLLSLVIAFCIVLPKNEAGAAIKEVVTNNSDYKKLEVIGIVTPSDNLHSTVYVTRAQFTRFVRKLVGLNIDINLAEDENPFEDIDSLSEYYSDIMTLYKMGFISAAKEFRPYENITPAEVAKLLVTALGYGDACEREGGYPYGYVSFAARIGILPKESENGGVTSSEVMRVLLKTLEIDTLQINSFVKNQDTISYSYEVNEGETLLYKVFGLEKTTGILEANQFTSIYGIKDTRYDTIVVDGEVYTVGDTNPNEFIGQHVELYYKDEGGKKTVVYVGGYDKKNTVITISSKDIYKNSIQQTGFTYFDNQLEKEQTVKFSRSLVFIHNFEQVPFQPQLLDSETANITLIDNNDDGTVDVINVEAYKVIKVSAVSKYTFTIQDSLNGETIYVDPDDNDYYVEIFKNGKKAGFDDIKENDIILYAASERNPKNYKKLLVSDNTISGMIETLDRDNKKVVINGEEFEIISQVADTITIGISGKFYLDAFLRICAWEGDSDLVFGYLNKLIVSKNLDQNIIAQIFTENNRWVELALERHILFGNEGRILAKTFFERYGTNPDNYRQLINYRVNSEGKITEMWFAEKVDVPWSNEEMELIEKGTFRLSRYFPSIAFRGSTNSFNGEMSLSNSTKVFFIPSQTADKSADLSEFSVGNLGPLIPDKTYTNVYGYNVSRCGVAEVCVIIGSENKAAVYDRSNMMLVGGFSKNINADGEEYTALKVFFGDELVSIPVKNEDVFKSVNGVQKGDILQCSFEDSTGSIINMVKRYDASKGTKQKYLTNNIYAGATFVAGRVHYFERSNSSIVIDYGSSYSIFSTKGCIFRIYDTKTNKAYVASDADIEQDDYVFGRANYLQMKELFIIR